MTSSVLHRDTGYSIREGSRILAARFAEFDRQEHVRQCLVRAGFARYLGKRYARRGRPW